MKSFVSLIKRIFRFVFADNRRFAMRMKILIYHVIFAIKYLLYKLGWKMNIDRMFGFEISFVDYQDFYSIFEETLIYGQYHPSRKRYLISDIGSYFGIAEIYYKGGKEW